MFETDCALSFKLESSPGVTNDSVTNNPILQEGVFVYLSSMIVWLATDTKNPLM